MANFPTSLDNGTSIPNPTGASTQNNPDHAALHSSTGDAVKAVETKLGTGASTPIANTILFGTGTGTSAWTALTSAQLAATLSDETGSGSAVFATTPTLVTPKVDTINESTLNNGVTVGGVNLKSGVIPSSAIPSAGVDYTKVATGFCVQQVSTTYAALATGTTTIPYDDTIPQITEGNEFMTQAITPKATTNKLEIEVEAFLSHSVASRMIVALFQDATANALHVVAHYQATATGDINMKLTYTMTAGTVSATTFRIRASGDSAGTTTFNGTAGSRFFGTASKSTIVIREYKV